MRFRDRAEAGRRLAGVLLPYRDPCTRVFGLGGGGVRVGFEVAQALDAPLDVWVAQRVEAPGEPGQWVGAIAEGEGLYLDPEGVRSAAAPASELSRWMDAQAGEVALVAQRLRAGHPRMEVGSCTAVLVVDGIGLGDVHVHAALRGLRRQHPRRLVLAAPVAAAEELERLRGEADAVLCVQPIWALLSVAHAYDDFQQLAELEVRQLLERARTPGLAGPQLGGDERGGWM